MTGTQLYLSIAASGDSVMGTRVVEKLLYQIDHGQVSPRLAQRVTLKILCRALQSEQMSWQDFVSCLKAVS